VVNVLDVQGGELYRAILDGVHDGVYVVTPDRTITYWNAGAQRLTGYAAHEAIGRRCFDGMLNHMDAAGNRLCGARCPLRATMSDGRERQAHVYAHHIDGHLVPLHVRAAPIRDQDGAIIGAVETFSDEAHTIAMREQMRTLQARVDTDPLTGLANRAHLDAQLGRALSSSDQPKTDISARLRTGPRTGQATRPLPPGSEVAAAATGVAVLFVDVDHFKRINDAHGHGTGDVVLKALSRTLLAACRTGDLAARYGGEEFVIALTRCDADTLGQMAARVQTLIREMRLRGPDGTPIQVTASLGGTIALPGETPTELLGRADALLYRAKAAGRNRYVTDVSGRQAPDSADRKPIPGDTGSVRPHGRQGRHAGPVSITPHQPGRRPGRHVLPPTEHAGYRVAIPAAVGANA
jgi:diguanylate cyclase (GGDEF)-like protein/PAS domain S-box-containing protein